MSQEQKPKFSFIPWGDKRGFEELIEAFYTYDKLRGDGRAVDIIYALAVLDDPRVFDALMKFWDTGRALPALCIAFGVRGDIRALPILRKFAQEHPDWSVPKWAIGMLGEPDYLDDLLKMQEEFRGIGKYEKPINDEMFEALEHIKNRSPK